MLFNPQLLVSLLHYLKHAQGLAFSSKSVFGLGRKLVYLHLSADFIRLLRFLGQIYHHKL
jgi:hypothetical protein